MKNPITPKHSLQVLISMLGLMQSGNVHYVKPGQAAQRKILKGIYKVNIGRSQYYSVVRYLVVHGYLRRQYRYDPACKPEIRQQSSLIAFSMKGALFLANLKIPYAFKILTQIKERVASYYRRFMKPSKRPVSIPKMVEIVGEWMKLGDDLIHIPTLFPDLVKIKQGSSL